MTRRCLPPVVIGLGRVSAADLAALRAGHGPLVAEVARAQEMLLAGLAPTAAGKIIVPLVVSYRRRRKLYFASGPISRP